MKIIPLLIISAFTISPTLSINLIVVGPVKFFLNNTETSSVSKLPPILEYFLQRIQAANSHYVHEDLSRPQTWEKPVYTLSPAEEEMFYGSASSTVPVEQEAVVEEDEDSITTSKYDNFEYVDEDNSTELLFEKITEAPPPFLLNNNQYVIYKIGESTEVNSLI